MPDLPPPIKDWPDDANNLSQEQVIRLYENGFAGAKHSPEEEERFRDFIARTGGWAYGASAAAVFGLEESGAGKLTILTPYIEQVWPGSLPGPAQQRGSCVAHSTKNALLGSLVCEIVSGKPDEVTGKIEGVPEVPPEGVRNGVLSTEAIYWYRGYNGDGWHCPAAARVACQESGLWLRKSYPELDLDLTRYSGSLEGKYGARRPPEEFQRRSKEHLCRTATELRSFEELRDFLANGYAVSSCGSEGFASTRNEDGVARRQGSWAHAMCYFGADDREEVKRKYGEPLVLVQNSWGIWCSGPRRVMGTDIEIPQGSFWARWSDVKRRYMVAFSSVNGWPVRKLPDFGATGRV